jgi:sugar/nucleoside kinase (ribokinase family)/DNA-binding transcriptional ArsR family regulator
MIPAADSRSPGVLVTVGDLVEDVIVWSDAPTRHATDNACVIRRSRGGSAANVAAFASALMPARFIGCVGEDPVADVLTSELAGHGVDVRVQRRGRTGTVVVLIDSRGERTMYPDRAAAADLTDVPPAWLESAAALHAPSYCFAVEPAATSVLRLIGHAVQAGVPVSLDASSTGMIEEYRLARYLDLVESIRPAVFFANAHEARLLDVARPQFAKTMTVVKNGAGSTIVTPPGGAPHAVPVPEAPPARDSTGAGDAFAAGFLAARAHGADPVEAARAGHDLARSVLFSPGATSSRPPAANVPAAGTDRSAPPAIDSQLAICHNAFVLDVDLIKALGSEKRLQVLEWLRDPVANFPPQRDGDLVEDGVCAQFIAEKLGVSPPTCGEHLKLLSRAGLVRGKKVKQWVFYKREEDRIARAKEELAGDW